MSSSQRLRVNCSKGWTAGVALALSLLVAAPALAAGRVVNFTAADGTPLTAMLYEAATRPAPAVILVHMLGRSKDEWAPFAERLQAVGITALAIDLRGHGRSGGNGADLTAMVGDVQAAAGWISTQGIVRPGAIAVVGASLGANLAALAAADSSVFAAVALVSPSLDYRGVRIDANVMKKIGSRPSWLAASGEDPYAVRSMKELAADEASREQHLSSVRGHGTALLNSDQELAAALVDWLRRTLIF
jgi:alpha-beta hydrolase superfamily lysophospholipase